MPPTAAAVHYENNAAFAAAEVEREIEISHWGNVYVEERYHVVRTLPWPDGIVPAYLALTSCLCCCRC